MTHKKFVLFDFDGVIADSFALAYDVAKTLHPPLGADQYRTLFEGNIYDGIKTLPGGMDPDEYFKLFEPRAKNEIDIKPGIADIIATLAERYTLVIVSSTITMPIREFLDRHRLLHHFAWIMGKDVHASKVEKMRMIFEKYGIGADDCVFITDTLGDMREAKEHEMGTIGVSWGFHAHETLEKGIPFRIVDTPAELHDAVDDYFAANTGL